MEQGEEEMKKALLVFFTLFSFLFQINCEKRSTHTGQTDWDAVKEIISQNPDVFVLGFFDTQPDTPFYREITQSDADIKDSVWIHPADSEHPFDYIPLTWVDRLKGKLHYRFNGESYEKPISTQALTNAYFERWGDIYDPHLGWLLMRFSGTVINSLGTTINLYTLEIVSEGIDTITNESFLLNLVKRDSILVFSKGKQVTFKIDVSDTSDFFFLHVKEGEAYQKIPFTSMGGGKFSASWTTTTDPNVAKGYHHAIVDVVSQKSVTDTTAEYDSKAWGIIYRIK